MTDKQREVLDQVYDLMSEHFDSFVYIYDLADVDDEGNHTTGAAYQGGIPMAMGLCMAEIERLRAKFLGLKLNE